MVITLTNNLQINYHIETGQKIVFGTCDGKIFGMIYKENGKYIFTKLINNSPGETKIIKETEVDKVITDLKQEGVIFHV